MRYQSYYILHSTLPQMAQWFRHEITQLLDEKVTLFTGFLIMKIISLFVEVIYVNAKIKLLKLRHNYSYFPT